MDITTVILLAAKKIGISGALLLAICTTETRLQNVVVHHDGGSPSFGICQVKLGTAKMLNYDVKSSDLMKPEVNAEIAGAYLKYQTDRYGGDKIKTIASYNAGRYNESKIVPGKPRNLKYVKRVLKTMRELERHEKL